MFFRGKQQTVILVAAVAMAAGFVLFRYLPLQKKMSDVKQRRTEQVLAIAKTSIESKQLPMLKAQLQQLQRAVGNYEVNIPAERRLGEFLQQIATLMNEHNLKEQLVQPGKETEADEFNCIPVNMQCKGRLNQIYEFYKQVQELDRLVRIEQVNLANDESLGSEVIMKTKAVIYYKPKDKQG
jgi:Tfp pilus assembly protein PilO